MKLSPSLRADEIGAAIHKDTRQNADSSPNTPTPSLRDFALAKSWQSISAQADSSKASKAYFASAKFMDCHAAIAARNDRENAHTSTNTASEKVDSRSEAQNLKTPAKDSRIFDNKAPNVSDSQAEASLDSSKSLSDSKILDEKCGLQGKSQRSYLSGDLWDFSPLPHFSLKAESPQVDSRIFTQTAQPAHHDSKNCGGAVGALRFLGKVSELGVRAFHKNRNTATLPTQS